MRSYWTASGRFLWRLVDLMALRNKALYGGFAVQAGQVYHRVDPVPDGAIYGASLYIGGPDSDRCSDLRCWRGDQLLERVAGAGPAQWQRLYTRQEPVPVTTRIGEIRNSR
jgi:hypothetical protein